MADLEKSPKTSIKKKTSSPAAPVSSTDNTTDAATATTKINKSPPSVKNTAKKSTAIKDSSLTEMLKAPAATVSSVPKQTKPTATPPAKKLTPVAPKEAKASDTSSSSDNDQQMDTAAPIKNLSFKSAADTSKQTGPKSRKTNG
ncbi:hypothetical protein, partial [Salmonella sp. s51228]|uniref:hypothetical protein n=1 Tax=Salmonella sp. s51228 TaxID=3159652 RepID=UPI0039806A1C